MIGRWINGKLRWYGRAADALSSLMGRSTRRGYRDGNAIHVDRDGRATTGPQRRKVVLRGKR